MASGNRTSVIAEQAIAASGTTTSSTFQLAPREREEILLITVAGRTDGTYTVSLEHSADQTNWVQIATGSGISANGIESVSFPDRHLPYLRAKVVAATVTTGATAVKVEVFSETANI